MTVKVKASKTVNAPLEAVWDILDDFENVANHTSQVKTSTGTSDQVTGVGATRHCDLAPMGTTEETILEYEPRERMVIALHDISGIPVKRSRSTFTLHEIDGATTRLDFESEVEPKGGPLAGFLGKRLEKRLPKGVQSMVDDFGAAAEASVRGEPSQ